MSHDELARSFAYELSARERRSASRLIEERVRTRRPLAYLIKEAWLGEHRFYVDERVVVPRSFIAELLRDRLSPWFARRRELRTALDLCTGSGCLAVLLALAFPDATVDAIDVSQPALAVARRNLRIYRLGRRVRLSLAGGRDGLEFVRRILLAARDFLRPGGLLVVEIGHNRSRLERAFPRLPFIWPETSAGCDCVFLLSREDLPGSALQ